MALGLGIASGCGKKDAPPADAGKAPPADTKAEADAGKAAPADEGAPSLQVADGADFGTAALPPEAEMVLYSYEGALLPLGCFRKSDGKIATGTDCLKVAPAGAEAGLISASTRAKAKVGAPTEPLCTQGDGKNTAVAVEGVTTTFEWGVYPAGAAHAVVTSPADSVLPEGKPFTGVELDAIASAIPESHRAGAHVHQQVEFDVDGDGKNEAFYSIYVPDGARENYAFSGLVVKSGDGKVFLAESSRSKQDVFEVRGTADLDGDGRKELWLRLVFAEGGGDRLYRYGDGKLEPLGAWSCGAARG